MRFFDSGASPAVLGIHALALAMICLSLGGYAGRGLVIAGIALVAVSFAVSRRVGRGKREPRTPLGIPAALAHGATAEAEAVATRVP